MKMKNFCISLLLLLCMLLTSVPVFADDFSDGSGFSDNPNTSIGAGTNDSNQNVPSSGYEMSGGYHSPIKLKKGKTVTAYICTRELAKMKLSGSKYKWTSSNKKVATVSSKGIVTAKKKGKTTITAKKGKTTYKCKLVVETPKLSKKTSSIIKGKTYRFKVSGTKQKVKWTSSDKSIISINSKGKAIAKKSGTAFITAKVSTYEFSQSVTVTVPTSPTPSTGSMTLGQKNALAKAKSYLSHSAFSHDRLIEQLEYEKFSTADATFAADNCGANWFEQALKKANSYLSHSAFSYKRLLEQLEYEKFTTPQATYAVNNCGTNWYEQAAKKAASYMSHSSFSRDRLISQLEYEGFTTDQAEYGVTQIGY